MSVNLGTVTMFDVEVDVVRFDDGGKVKEAQRVMVPVGNDIVAKGSRAVSDFIAEYTRKMMQEQIDKEAGA